MYSRYRKCIENIGRMRQRYNFFKNWPLINLQLSVYGNHYTFKTTNHFHTKVATSCLVEKINLVLTTGMPFAQTITLLFFVFAVDFLRYKNVKKFCAHTVLS